MMKAIKLVLIFSMIFFLSSCSSMGLAFLNTTKAKINNGIYRGSIGKQAKLGTFNIKVPQSSHSYEFNYLQMKEDIGQDSSYVSFGPAALDFTIYRVIVGVKDPVPFIIIKQRSSRILTNHTEKVYGQPMHKIYETNTTLHGHPGFYTVYTQNIPSYFSPVGLHEVAGTVLTHSIYHLDYGKYFVVLWTMSSSSGARNPVNDHNRGQLINRTWKPQMEFVNSFHIN